MGDVVFLPLEDYFRKSGSRRAVILCQLPLTVTVAFILGLVALFSPATFSDPLFMLVPILHLAILGASVFLPWDRLPGGIFVLVPVADCFAVAFMREVSGPALSVVGLLMAFPVIWLAVSARKARVALAILAPLVATVISPFMVGGEIERSELIRMIVFPTIMTGLAVTGYAIALGVIRNRERLDRKDRELADLHQATRNHAQLMDSVLETVTVGVWAVNSKGEDILTNRRLRADRIWADGATTEEQQNPFTSCNGEGPAHLALRGASFTNRLVRVGMDGQQRTFSAAGRPLLDQSGRLNGSTIAFTDVTDLLEAQEIRDKFVATVSHELRTPLTSILGYLEISDGQPGPRVMDIIERNAHRLLSLVNDLLLVASEDLELRPRPTNVSELLRESARSAMTSAAAKDITIWTRRADEVTAVVDPGQLSKALDHVLSNAIKFSLDGGRVTLDLRQHDGSFEFSIEDQGIGMTGDELEQAFAKFFRAKHSMETAIPGAGLGLPLSKAIVEAHGGAIDLNSEPGGGHYRNDNHPHLSPGERVGFGPLEEPFHASASGIPGKGMININGHLMNALFIFTETGEALINQGPLWN